VIAPSDHTADCSEGCLHRQLTGPIMPEMFGGKPDGATDATSAVQAALDSIKNNFPAGASLEFSTGTWILNGPDIVDSPNVTITGPGLIKSPATWTSTTNALPSFGTRHVLFWGTSNSTNLTFDEMHFDGSSSTVSGSDTVQVIFIAGLTQHLIVRNSNFHCMPIRATNPVGGLFIQAGEQGEVTGNIFDNCANGQLGTAAYGGGALYFGTPGNDLVVGNMFFNPNDTIVTLDSTGVSPPLNRGIVVTGNYFDGGTYGPGAYFGALTLQSGSYGAVFSGNYSYSLSNVVYIQNTGGATASPLNLTVDGNTFDMSNGAAFAYSDVSPNTGSSAASNAIEVTLSNNNVINLTNSCTLNPDCSGFEIGGSGYNIIGNTIVGTDATAGILFNETSAGAISNVTVAHNKFYTLASSSAGSGINVFSNTTLTNVKIEDNDCFDLAGVSNTCVNIQNPTTADTKVVLKDNQAVATDGSSYGTLYAGTPWGTIASTSLPAVHTLDNVSSGYFVSSNIPTGSAVPLTTNTPANITSITLAPGDWEVSANILYNPASATVTSSIGWISTISATVPSPPNFGALTNIPISLTTTSNGFGGPVGTEHFSLTAPATVYLSTQVTFSAGSIAAYGFIGATRIH